MSATIANLNDLLCCPICKETRRNTPYFICNNGHSICKVCYGDMVPRTTCPFGECDYPHPLIRNRHLESMILSHTFPCKNADRGCPFEGLSGSLDEHEPQCQYRTISCTFEGCSMQMLATNLDLHISVKHIMCKFRTHGCTFNGKADVVDGHEPNCEYREVPCPEGGCQSRVPCCVVFEHIKAVHPESRICVSTNGNVTIKWPSNDSPQLSNSWNIVLQKHDDRYFIFRLQRSEEQLLNTWVQVVGPPNLAEKYVVLISVKNESRKIKMSSGCRVLPVDQGWQHVLAESEDTLELSKKMELKCWSGVHSNIGFSKKLVTEYRLSKTSDAQRAVRMSRSATIR